MKAPVLIAEVLSPSTRDIDQREKQISYAQISGLIEYMVVYQDEVTVDIYGKSDSGQFEKSQYVVDQEIELKSLPKCLTLKVSDLYDGVD